MLLTLLWPARPQSRSRRIVQSRNRPILSFDADGAQAFDEKVAGAKTTAPWWVLDMSELSYLSSIGLRSLVMLEKTLRGRSGGIMLAGTPSLVAQVLRVSRLGGWIRAALTVDDALAAARAGTVLGPAVEHRVGAMGAFVSTPLFCRASGPA